MFGQRKKPAECSDEELMRLLQSEAPHNAALDEIYRRYSVALLRYFYRMMWKDNEKAQDMLHDVFVRLIENKNGFDANRSFKTWVYSIAFNMCKNEYRKYEFRRSADQATTFVEEFDQEIEVRMDDDQFRERLSLLLETFKEDDKNLFALRYESELSFAEISAILGVAEGTAKSRLFYLKKKLAEKLATYRAINR